MKKFMQRIKTDSDNERKFVNSQFYAFVCGELKYTWGIERWPDTGKRYICCWRPCRQMAFERDIILSKMFDWYGTEDLYFWQNTATSSSVKYEGIRFIAPRVSISLNVVKKTFGAVTLTWPPAEGLI